MFDIRQMQFVCSKRQQGGAPIRYIVLRSSRTNPGGNRIAVRRTAEDGEAQQACSAGEANERGAAWVRTMSPVAYSDGITAELRSTKPSNHTQRRPAVIESMLER
jgi:hypothetical protein